MHCSIFSTAMMEESLLIFLSTCILILGRHMAVTAVDPEVYMNTTALIAYYGYPVENHYVETKDGFILNIQRIPYGLRSPPGNGTKPVVILQHGVLAGSDCFVMNLPKWSIGFLLADAGYDVWLPNSRGNVYSMSHKSLNPSQEKFWDWSYDELASYDLPACVNYILNNTGVQKVSYVGHSQGTLISFAGLSNNVALQSKFNLFIALAPIAKVQHIGGLLGFVGHIVKREEDFYEVFGHKSFGTNSSTSQWISGTFCSIKQLEHLCNSMSSLISGFDTKNANISRTAVFMNHLNEGTSTKNIVHYAQGVQSSDFKMYDYGNATENMKHYNQTTPPSYKAENIKIPVALFTGPNDFLADPTDVAYLKNTLPNTVYEKEIPDYNHADFLVALNSYNEVFLDMLKLIKTYNR